MHPVVFKIMNFLVSFCAFEIAGLLLFTWIRKTFTKNNTSNKKDWSILKGLIERFMLLLGFIAGIPTIIVFFGAIKIGTRLKESNDSSISNDYFLIGNIVSAIVVLFEYLCYQFLTN
jgi:hypothetical protein